MVVDRWLLSLALYSGFFAVVWSDQCYPACKMSRYNNSQFILLMWTCLM